MGTFRDICVKFCINFQKYTLEEVGCNNPWNEWVGNETRRSQTFRIPCGKVEDILKINTIMVDLTLLSIEELEDLTKCSKPCKYNVFSLAEEAEIDGNGTKVYFSLASKKIISKKEVYLYTFSSLIAELGGALGLFLGFSFYSFIFPFI